MMGIDVNKIENVLFIFWILCVIIFLYFSIFFFFLVIGNPKSFNNYTYKWEMMGSILDILYTASTLFNDTMYLLALQMKMRREIWQELFH